MIRLGGPERSEEPEETGTGTQSLDGMRRGFDYQAFTARLESLWFQRKALLADGRRDDAARQAELIRAYCEEEGVRRLPPLGAALTNEAEQLLDSGHYEAALDSLSLAAALDPGRPQLRVLRAKIYWKSGQGYFTAGAELLSAVREAVVLTLGSLGPIGRLGVIAVLCGLGAVFAFSLVMLLRYHVAFRHEIEEGIGQRMPEHWARAAGWALLFLPMIVWIGAGWAAFYWIAILFRFMRPTERATALGLLAFTVLSVPLFSATVTLYGMSADPLLRATLAATEGQYAPDRVIQLRRLVETAPDNPTYRFLLAGLYKNGRFFEESFDEYMQALQLDPQLEEAHVNVGNIFYLTGQHAEAIANYNRAIEINPYSVEAHYNSHLAQSEDFRFKDAEASLRQARAIDAERVASLLSGVEKQGQRAMVIDATLQPISLWDAALRGASPLATATRQGAAPPSGGIWQGVINPMSAGAVVALVGIVGLMILGHGERPARRCVRCGQPFCRLCKSTQRGQEYCNQCMHLFVLGDGLAPDAKHRKQREVDRYDRRSRLFRRSLALALPGTAHLLRGHTVVGTALIFGWFVALLSWNPLVLRPLERLFGIDIRLDLLQTGLVPPSNAINVVGLVALLSALAVWLLGNLTDPRGKVT